MLACDGRVHLTTAKNYDVIAQHYLALQTFRNFRCSRIHRIRVALLVVFSHFIPFAHWMCVRLCESN